MTGDSGETSATYSLSEDFLGGKILEIDKYQYTTLSEALVTLVAASDVEESFQVFAQSVVRFEKDLLDLAFEYAYSNKSNVMHEDFLNTVRYRINVNVLTVLTSYKCYDDHCARIMSSLNPRSAEEFNSRTRENSYNTHLSYRICAQLRDYAQHRALPLGGFSIGGKANLHRDNAGNAIKIDTGFNVSPWLDVEKFRGSSQCKAALRQELEKLGFEKIDMKWLLRSFAGAMHERHVALREFLKPEIEVAGKKISDGYELATSQKKDRARFLVLCCNGECRTMRDDLAEIILRAFKTSDALRGASHAYITSQITPESQIYSGQPY